MRWKAIGQSVTGTSHTATGKGCEDAIRYVVATDADGHEAMICCASDGAGSAIYGGEAAVMATETALNALIAIVQQKKQLTEGGVYMLLEDIYAELLAAAAMNDVPADEYSCTLLACCITRDQTLFFQVGDGAIVRNDGNGYYTPVWWPHNGEYQNTTTFIVDDPAFGNLNIQLLDEAVREVALFSDGLQMLALRMEDCSVHQPFFTDLFRFLRMANDEEKVNVLNRKLAEYLGGRQINERTDDDKTLFLATTHTR